MIPAIPSWVFASVATTVTAVILHFTFRKRREEADQDAFERAKELNLHIPPSLHPVIDPKVCMGSYSCLKVCPEGDILGVIEGKAALIQGANCIGHGRCALECPVDAIRLVFGTSERGVDLPEIDEFFESSRAGVHIIGELGGMGLIRNAMTQGLQLADRLGSLPKATLKKGQVDVAIVGGGPAGIALGLGLKKYGMSFRIVDQDSLGGTVANYPRQKIVMMDTLNLPFVGRFGKSEISKEELLHSFQKMLKKAEFSIEERTRVTGVEGEDGNYSVTTSGGPMYARKVALACGRRGSPRKLGAKGEDSAKVTYRLIDPEQYEGKRVLVVGGGDAALEAAIGLAGVKVSEVSISYRGPAFGRCRPANKEKIESLISAGRVRAVMNSTVSEVRTDSVLLNVNGSETKLKNDFVIVLIGGDLPLEFLKSVGVSVQRHFGTAPERKRRAVGSVTSVSRVARDELAEEERRRRRSWLYFWTGAAIITFLAGAGWSYYVLPPVARVRSSMHGLFRPAGNWGHGVGIIATFVMLTNFLYSARKRLRLFKGRTSIRGWLTFHMFVGFMSPLVILFHAAFQSNNLFATMTFFGLLIVVGTGVIGRFIYGLLPLAGDGMLTMSELLSRFEQHKASIRSLVNESGKPEKLRGLIRWLTAAEKTQGIAKLFFNWPRDYLSLRFGLLRARPTFRSRADYLGFRNEMFQLLRLRRQLSSYSIIRRVVSKWRIIHISMALFLVVLIAVHIYITTYYGYRWIF